MNPTQSLFQHTNFIIKSVPTYHRSPYSSFTPSLKKLISFQSRQDCLHSSSRLVDIITIYLSKNSITLTTMLFSTLKSFLSFTIPGLLISTTTLITAQSVYEGCYAIDDNLNLTDTSIFQSQGRCGGAVCGPKGFAVFGMSSGSQCLCGNAIPVSQVTGDNCNVPCPGYPNDTCISSPFLSVNLGGAVGYISVWLTGVGKLKGNAATTILPTTAATITSSVGTATSQIVYITTGRTSPCLDPKN